MNKPPLAIVVGASFGALAAGQPPAPDSLAGTRVRASAGFAPLNISSHL